MLKEGDLVQSVHGKVLATVVRGPYTHRFMDSYDYELCAAGHGDLAGTYTSAYDIVITASDDPRRIGKKTRIKSGSTSWKRA